MAPLFVHRPSHRQPSEDAESHGMFAGGVRTGTRLDNDVMCECRFSVKRKRMGCPKTRSISWLVPLERRLGTAPSPPVCFLPILLYSLCRLSPVLPLTSANSWSAERQQIRLLSKHPLKRFTGLFKSASFWLAALPPIARRRRRC